MLRGCIDVDPDPGDVQWYYSATSTPARCVSDVPGKADFVKFCDGDSLLLESIYRKNPARYDKEWRQQHEDVMDSLPAKPTTAPAAEEMQADLEPCGPVVRSGYYEADIASRRVYPVYWPEAPRMLMRGTWFVQAPGQQNTLIPLPHSIASKLEEAWQQKKFDSTQITSDHRPQPDGTYGTRIELGGLLESSYYAIFTDRNNLFLCAKDSQSVLKNLTPFKASGARLHRGYDPVIERDPSAKKEHTEQTELSSFEARTVGMAVRHLVLAVHGIGQRMGGRTIADDAQAVRRRVNAMLDDYMPDEIGKGYIQVLPIQWRKNLDLEADQVADSIMPEGARSFRQLAHNTCVEVLMYMSPSHAQNILDSVATNLNCTYLRFVRRHAEFSGRISILAYSLGSVLCYDLLAHQPVPRESAPAQAFGHVAALHNRAREERRRRQEEGGGDAVLGLELGAAPAGWSPDGRSNAEETQSAARSTWLSYWGLFKKSVNGGGSPAASRVHHEDASLVRGKSLLSGLSDEDPVVCILDNAAASMQADAAMWQSQGKMHDREATVRGMKHVGKEDGKEHSEHRRNEALDARGGFPPQRWLGRLARKLGKVRPWGRQDGPELPVHPEDAEEVADTDSALLETGSAEIPVSHCTDDAVDAAEVRSGPQQGTVRPLECAQRHDAAGELFSQCVGISGVARGSSPVWWTGTADAATDAEDKDESAFDDGGPEGAMPDGPISGSITARRVSTDDRGAASEHQRAASESGAIAVVPLSSVLGSRSLAEVHTGHDAAPGGCDMAALPLQQQLEALQAQAAATAAQISELQAQLRRPTAGTPFADPVGRSEVLVDRLAQMQRSPSHQCLPAEAPHSMLPERSMQLPAPIEEHHTYGMGELREAPAAVSPLCLQQHPADEPHQLSDARIAQTRVLWPGSALHELDAKQQQPLTMQALRYPELSFLVDNFIMIGSPAGLFAALRGVNPTKGRPLGSPAAGMMCPGSAPGGLPVCRRMYNVFHPFDPVAYRMEPLIQKDDCPRPQLVPYHRGGRKLKMNIVDAGENVAKTMDKVAAAFTFTFRRSKEEALEPAAEPVDYLQCSVAPYLLGLPLLLPSHDEELSRVPSRISMAPGPAGNNSVASGEMTVRSAPEAWRAADSPRTLFSQKRLSNSSETLVRMGQDGVDDVETGSVVGSTGAAGGPDSPGARMLHLCQSATSHGTPHPGAHSGAAPLLRHTVPHPNARGAVPRLEATTCSAALVRTGAPSESTSARAFRNAADAAPGRSRRVLAGAGQGGVCPQGHGGSVGRLDFQLQEDFVETQFFGAFRAHFCYWKHEDVALLVCRAACGYDVVDGTQESPDAPA